MRRYFDELRVGDRFTSAEQAMPAGEIKAFARQFDPQPFHLDEAAAAGTLFGGLVASGWHTAAVSMRLMVDGGLPIAGQIIGTQAELTFRAPVRAGDRLRVNCEILALTPSRSKPDRGAVRVRSDTVNQDGLTVLRMETTILAFRRPPG